MDRPIMRGLGVVFFVSMGLFVVLGIAAIFSPSETVAKAVGVFALIGFGSLFLMVGGLILERFDALQERSRPGAGFAA
jgi:predicted membrane channel-forming protein YqfA (hemolysin III family)